jgi:hypothetical protein
MNPMYAQMGLQIATGVTGWMQDGIQSRLARSMQKYKNQMRELTAAMNESAIMRNEVAMREASMAMLWQIKKQGARDQGTAVVSAAAAGVSGQSIDKSLRHLKGSELNAVWAEKSRLRGKFQETQQQKTNNRVGAIMGMDITHHPRASIGAHMMGMAAGLFDIQQANQPPGDRGSSDPTNPSSDQFVDWWQ